MENYSYISLRVEKIFGQICKKDPRFYDKKFLISFVDNYFPQRYIE